MARYSQKHPAVYILTNRRNGTLYIGVTSNLPQRLQEHKDRTVEGFTKKYGLHLLVYYEVHADMRTAVTREQQMKKWNRRWKVRLIESMNPEWRDLTEDIGP